MTVAGRLDRRGRACGLPEVRRRRVRAHGRVGGGLAQGDRFARAAAAGRCVTAGVGLPTLAEPMPAPVRARDPRPVTRWAWLAALLVVATGAAGCQPFDDEPPPDAVGTQTPDGDAAAVGAPDAGVPGDLAGLVARTKPEASRWQPQPQPAEAVIELDGASWRAASVTYVAAGAESVLVVRVEPDGLSTQRVNFEPLGLEPIPADALADLPPLGQVSPPAGLVGAAEAEFGACDAEPPAAEIRLATGAPASWEGDGWAQEPRWRAVVTDAEGVGVRLDAVSADVVDEDRCVAPAPSPQQ